MKAAHITHRERECLTYVAKGFTLKMIAKELGLSPRTVESYLRNFKERIGIKTKCELIMLMNNCNLFKN